MSNVVLCPRGVLLHELSTNQLQIMKGLLTGHYYLKRRVFNLGLVDSLRWEDNIKMDHREVGGGHGRYRSGSG